MTRIPTVSQDQLQQRRKTLRRQRRLRLGRVFWQMLALSGLTTLIFWGATRPIWLIQRADQIDVTGNQLLSDQAVRALLPLHYPQPLLKVEPDTLAEQLLSRAPIMNAQITRQLFPPKLKVTIQERQPVAITLPATNGPKTAPTDDTLPPGFLDAEGAWMPRSSFALFQAMPSDLPVLKVRGLQPQYQPYWPQIFQALQTSSVKITELDWRDPRNLVLHTELGEVYLGPYGSEFAQQIATLAQLQNLPDQMGDTSVAHIDLTNPNLPSVAVNPPGLGTTAPRN